MTAVTLSAKTQQLIQTAVSAGGNNVQYNVAAYNAIAADLAAPGFGIDPGTLNWFSQAGLVNGEQSTPSAAGAFIWGYTQSAIASLGGNVTTQQIQQASNHIALQVFQVIQGDGYVVDDQNNLSPRSIVALENQTAGQDFQNDTGMILPESIWGGTLFAATELDDSTFTSDWNVNLATGSPDTQVIQAGLLGGIRSLAETMAGRIESGQSGVIAAQAITAIEKLDQNILNSLPLAQTINNALSSLTYALSSFIDPSSLAYLIPTDWSVSIPPGEDVITLSYQFETDGVSATETETIQGSAITLAVQGTSVDSAFNGVQFSSQAALNDYKVAVGLDDGSNTNYVATGTLSAVSGTNLKLELALLPSDALPSGVDASTISSATNLSNGMTVFQTSSGQVFEAPTPGPVAVTNAVSLQTTTSGGDPLTIQITPATDGSQTASVSITADGKTITSTVPTDGSPANVQGLTVGGQSVDSDTVQMLNGLGFNLGSALQSLAGNANVLSGVINALGGDTSASGSGFEIQPGGGFSFSGGTSEVPLAVIVDANNNVTASGTNNGQNITLTISGPGGSSQRTATITIGNHTITGLVGNGDEGVAGQITAIDGAEVDSGVASALNNNGINLMSVLQGQIGASQVSSLSPLLGTSADGVGVSSNSTTGSINFTTNIDGIAAVVTPTVSDGTIAQAVITGLQSTVTTNDGVTFTILTDLTAAGQQIVTSVSNWIGSNGTEFATSVDGAIGDSIVRLVGLGSEPANLLLTAGEESLVAQANREINSSLPSPTSSILGNFANDFVVDLSGGIGGFFGGELGSQLGKDIGINPQVGSIIGSTLGNAAFEDITEVAAEDLFNITLSVPPSGAALLNGNLGGIAGDLGNAFGSYAGEELAQLTGFANSLDASIGADIGAAVGAYLLPIPFIGSLIGAYIGDIIGALIEGTPESETWVSLTANDTFAITASKAGGGMSSQIGQNMGAEAASLINDVLGEVGGEIANIVPGLSFEFGMHGMDGNDPIYLGAGTNFADPTAAVQQGAIAALKQIQFQGGDINLETAIASTNATTFAELESDLEVARDYESYAGNPMLFELGLENSDDPTIGQQWAQELARANFLGLTTITGPSDYTRAADIAAYEAGLGPASLQTIASGVSTASGNGETLAAGSGATTFTITGNVSTLIAGAGDDTLAATGNANFLEAGNGLAVLEATGMANILMGGSASVTLTTSGSGNTLIAGSANDTLSATGSGDTLLGGTGTADILASGTGEMLDAGSGNATLSVSGNSNLLESGTGHDTLVTTGNLNALVGGSGGDLLEATGNQNELGGGTGEVTAIASGSQNILVGGSGFDTLIANGSNNTLGATTAAAVLEAFGDSNTLAGGSGNDTIAATGNNEVVYGSRGYDIVSVSGANATIDYSLLNTPVTADLKTGIATKGSAGSDLLSGISNIVGSAVGGDTLIGLDTGSTLEPVSGNDTLIGGSNNDWASFALSTQAVTINLATDVNLGGNAQGDTLLGINNAIGSDFNDVLFGNGGNDTFSGGGGDNTIVGGTGTTTVDYAASPEAVVVNLATGTAWNGFVGLDTLKNVQNVVGPSALPNTLIGNAGSNVLAGGGTLIGGGGTDTYLFNSGYGQDIIDNQGDTSNSTLQFGAGIEASNVAVSRVNNDLLLQVNGSSDSVDLQNYFNGSPVAAIGFAGGTSWTYQTALGMVDTPSATNHVLIGDSGHNLLDGSGGNDTLIGNGGTDTYIFGSGYGQEIVDNTSSLSVLEIAAGIAASDITAVRENDNLLLELNGTGDSALLQGYYTGQAVSAVGFSDGSTLSGSMLSSLTTPPSNTVYGNGATVSYTFTRGSGHEIIDNIPPLFTELSAAEASTLAFTDANSSDVMASRSNDDLILRISGTQDQVTVQNYFMKATSAVSGRISAIGFADGTSWNYQTVLGIVDTASATNQTLLGDGNSNVLDGNFGNDTLIGDIDNNPGSQGTDTYLFGRGYGQDVIDNMGGNAAQSELVFKAGVAPADVVASRTNDDLILRIAGSQSQVTVQQYFRSTNSAISGQLGTIGFSDGTTWTYENVLQMVDTASATNQILIGDGNSNTLDGNFGNDTLIGNPDNDAVVHGIDTYVFGRGYGQDVIDNLAGDTTNSLLLFHSDTAPSDVQALRSGNDLVLVIAGTHSQATMQGYFLGSYSGQMPIQFSNGTIWSYSTVSAMVSDAPSAGATLYGSSGTDTLNGSGGSDTLVGNGGADTYIFGRGYGNEVIDNSGDLAGQSVLDINAGVALSDLQVSRSGNDLLLAISGTSDQATIKDYFSNPYNRLGSITLSNGSQLTVPAALDGTLSGSGATASFFYNEGDGPVTIEGRAQQNTLVFGPGITQSDVLLKGVGNDLDILFGNSPADSIDIANQFSGYPVASATFADGSSLSLTQLTFTHVATASDTILTGSNYGANVFELAPGSDTVTGGASGVNTLDFDKGDGSVLVNLNGGTGVLQFASDIAPSDVVLQADSSGDLTIVLKDTGDRITFLDDVSTNRPPTSALTQIDFASGPSIAIDTSSSSGAVAWIAPSSNTTLVGGSSTTTLFGTLSGETLVAGTSATTAAYGQNDVTLNLSTGSASIPGAADSLVGITNGLVFGDNDTLIGGTGSDVLASDGANNVIIAGDSSSTLLSAGTGDTLIGTAAGDTLDGATGTGIVAAYTVAGAVVNLAAGTATLQGATAYDTLLDISIAEAFGPNDTLLGGSGNTTLLGNLSGATLIAGTGTTTAAYGTTGAVVNLASGMATIEGSADSDSLIGITDALLFGTNETLAGGAGADVLSSAGRSNTLIGGSGANTLISNGTGDTLLAGTGNDVLASSGSLNTLIATTANDSLFSDGAGDTLIGTASGDTLDGTGATSVVAQYLANSLVANLGAGTVGIAGSNAFDTLLGISDVAGLGSNDTLIGGSGPSTLTSSAAGNTLIGGSSPAIAAYGIGDAIVDLATNSATVAGSGESDTLAGISSALTYGNFDTIIGGAGAEVLSGNGRYSTIVAGSGADTLTDNGFQDTLLAGSGTDTLSSTGKDNVLIATNANDYLSSTGFTDTLIGTTDGDTIDTRNSTDDEVSYQINNAVVDLTAGTAYVNGSDTFDNLLGVSIVGIGGSDTLIGGFGTEDLTEGGSNSTIIGGSGNDQLSISGDGGDTLIAGTGGDFMYSQGSGDVLIATTGFDTLVSYGANDTFIGTGAGDTLDGTHASLPIMAGYTASNVTVNLSTGEAAVNGSGAFDTLVGISDATAFGSNETLIGGSGTATLTAAGNNDTLIGDSGAQTLTASGSNDTALAGTGYELLTASGLGDALIATTNEDTLSSTGTSDTLLGMADGDTLAAASGATNPVAAYKLNNVVVNLAVDTAGLNGSGTFDTLVGISNAEAFGANDTLIGGTGTTTLIGNASGSTLESEAGVTVALYAINNATINLGTDSAELNGSSTSDMLVGIADVVVSGRADTVIGGSGADIIVAAGSNDTLVAEGAGTLLAEGRNDTLFGSSSGVNTLLSSGSSDTLIAGAGTDSLISTGVDNSLIGTTGADVLISSGSDDTLFGTASGDTLNGSAGVNILAAYTPSDVVVDLATGLASVAGSDVGDTLLGITYAAVYGTNDTLVGGTGPSTLSSNAGGNTLVGGTGASAVTYALNNLTVDLATGRAFATGSTVFDTLVDISTASVSGNGDTLLAGGASETLTTSGERGTLIGGFNGDTLASSGFFNSLIAGAGNELLSTSGVSDTLVGGTGADTLTSTGSYTTLESGSGVDTLLSNGFGNVLIAGSAADTLIAGGYSSTLIGGSGTDTLSSSGTGNTLIGGSAADMLVSNGTGDTLIGNDLGSTLDGAGGTGVVAAYTHNNAVMNLATDTAGLNGGNEQDTLIGISVAAVYGNDDTIIGGSGTQTLSAAGPNDTIIAGSSADILLATGTGDTLIGTAGGDTLDGPSGFGAIAGYTLSNVTVNLGSGQAGVNGSNTYDTLVGISSAAAFGTGDTLIGGAGVTTLFGNGANNTLEAGSGATVAAYASANAVVNLAAGTASVNGVSGSDSLIGINDALVTANNDTLIAGDAAGTLVAAGSGDTLVGAVNGSTLEAAGGVTAVAFYSTANIDVNLATDTVEAANSSDSLVGMMNATVSGVGDLIVAGRGIATLSAWGTNDTLVGGSGVDTLLSTGSSNSLFAGSGTDALVATGSDNLLVARAGTDVLTASGHDSTLIGGSGTDTLSSNGTGNTLIGGSAADQLLSSGADDTLIGNGLGSTLDGAGGTGVVAAYTLNSEVVNLATDTAGLNGGNKQDTLIGISAAAVYRSNDTIIGGSGTQILSAAGTDDTLIGTAGGATLDGSSGLSAVAGYTLSNVTVNLGSGQAGVNGSNTYDTLIGISSAAAFGTDDTLIGGAGVTTLFGNGANNTLEAGTGTTVAGYASAKAVVNLATGMASVNGVSGSDTLIGINDALVIGNNDTLIGGAGAEILSSNGSFDTIVGGSGNETLLNSGSVDVLVGGSGTDTLSSSGTRNTLIGASAADQLLSSGTNDTLIGNDLGSTLDGAGGTGIVAAYTLNNEVVNLATDTAGLNGGNEQDTLIGISAAAVYGNNDTIIGGSGTQTLSAAGPNDTIIAGSSADILLSTGTGDTLIGTAGGDTLDGSSGLGAVAGYTLSNVTVNLGSDQAGVNGSNAYDTLVGISSAAAFGTDDTLIGGAGVTTLFGNGANNTLEAGTGTTVAAYALANAVVNLATSAASVSGVSGSDTLIGINDALVIGNNDTLIGGAGAEILSSSGSFDTIVGGSGNEFLFTSGSTDVLAGGSGTDTLSSSGTGNTLIGGSGTDTLSSSGTGNTLIGGSAADQLLSSGTDDTLIGNDLGSTLDGAGGTGVVAAYALNNEVVNLATDTAGLNGGNEQDTLIGISAAAVYGNNDTIIGDSGTDTLSAVGTNDTLIGGSGPDVMNGKGSNDVLIGNGGGDTFIFNPGYGHLEISETDFATNPDNVLELGSGINPSNVSVTSTGSNIILTDGVSGDQITIDGMLSNTYSGVQTVSFSNSTSWSRQDVINKETTGTTGNDTLYGSPGADTFDGKGGNDYEQGNGGNDTFIFNPGYGHIEISEYNSSASANAVLQLGAGINESSIHVGSDGLGDFILTDGIAGDQIKLDGELSSSDDGVQTIEFADGTTWTRQTLIDMEVTGTTGNDTLYGSPGADIFDGKGGNDYEQGNGGGDTFIFNSGYGHLEINEEDFASNPDNTLEFGSSISPSSVTVSISGNNVLLTDGVTGDQVTIDNMLSASYWGVQAVSFANGTNWSRQEIRALVGATQIYGTTGNDNLTGTSGANVFDGKGGNDVETGNGGGDAFIFNSGYGHLGISETDFGSNPHNSLLLGAGITAANMHVTSDGNSIILTDGVSGDQITLVNMLTHTAWGVQTVSFADGTSWARQDVINKETTGTTGNDVLYGSPGADTFDGKGGNDYEQGDGGNDTFIFNSGYGHLEINELDLGSNPNNTLKFGSGINASNVSVTSTSSNIIFTDGITGDQVTIDNMLTQSYWGLDNVSFADGTDWTRQEIINYETTGTTGNNTLYGSNGADTFDGKGGNDYEQGDGGADIYKFNEGYGQLTIANSTVGGSGAHGDLVLGSGITDEDLWFTNSSNNLIIQEIGNSDKITVSGWFGTNTSSKLAEIELSSGLMLDSQLSNLVSAMATYSTNNPSFNPATAAEMPTDTTLQSAITSAWHS